MKEIKLFPPVRGVYIDLAEVPDPVFAEKMVGDGFAIDPLDNVVYAPVSGKIKLIHRAKHAITIDSELGFDILIHLGLETVSLDGKGFTLNVKEGDVVKAGDKLSEFDLDFVAENSLALITPVLVTDLEDKNIVLEILKHDHILDINKCIMLIKYDQPEYVIEKEYVIEEREKESLESGLITIPNLHGIHARPAAKLNIIARKFTDNEILMFKGEKSANVKSVVSLLSLAVSYKDQVKLLVKGSKGQVVIDELRTALLALEDDAGETEVGVTCSNSNIIENGLYHGVVSSSGIALAKLTHMTKIKFNYEETGADSHQEITVLSTAIENLVNQIEAEIKALSEFDIAYKNILSAHLMILTDHELADKARNLILAGSSAPFAWEKATKEACEILASTGNELLIERQSDLIDVKDRVLTVFCGAANKTSIDEYDEDVILVASDYTPSQIIGLSKKVRGLVSVKGGVTSHVSILARAKGIPLLVGVAKEVLQESSKIVILDTLNNAILNCNPTDELINKAKNEILTREEQLQVAQKSSGLPAITSDGKQISCFANIGNQEEARLAAENGAEGVGLFRTEFMFMEREDAPGEEFQLEEYQAIVGAMGDKCSVVRTLDVGGDKKVPYLSQTHEENPMLGVRGIRLCLANRELFKTQLRAIIRVKSDKIKIMIPMISKISEYRIVRQIFEEAKTELGVSADIKLGIMVEVPSVAFLSEAFAREVDFMSIGTNDLTQYIMAIDREHPELSKEADHLHPALLAAIKSTADGAIKHNTELSVCGLMASEKLAIPVLIGLGIEKLSMTINTIPENKAFIRNLNYMKCKSAAEHCLTLSTAVEVREYLKDQFSIV